MAQHHDNHDGHHDPHHPHAHAYDPEAEERMSRDILADREWIFDRFIRFTAWNVLLIAIILALLAFTQT